MAQSGHALAQFCLEHPDQFQKWNNQYLISLSIPTKEKLESLLSKLMRKGIQVSYFTEPDLDDELTSICFVETEQTRKMTAHLRLALEEYNNELINV